jgi:hypothetical protein
MIFKSRLAIHLLAGVMLTPFAAGLGFVTTSLFFPFAILGIMLLWMWYLALAMAAMGTIFVLPIAASLNGKSYLADEQYGLFCGSCGCLICVAFWLFGSFHWPTQFLSTNKSYVAWIFFATSGGAFLSGYACSMMHRYLTYKMTAWLIDRCCRCHHGDCPLN